MYCKLFFCFLAVGYCAASIYGENYITVNHDGSYSQIVSRDTGFKIEIIKNKYVASHGLKDFEVILTGPSFYKVFHINNQIAGDVLTDLCVRYQGAVDDVTFQKILYKIENYVQQGDLHPKVFYMFQTLLEEYYQEAIQHLVGEETYGDDYLWSVYGKTFQGPYGIEGLKNLYLQKYSQYGLYGNNYYQSQYSPYNVYQGLWYGNLYGKNYNYGPYGANKYYNLYKHQYPYGGKYNLGYNVYDKYGLQNVYEQQVEKKIEHEVEQEVEEQLLENQLTHGYYGQRYPGYYGQRYPLAQSTLYNKYWEPRTYQYGLKGYSPYAYYGRYYGAY